MDDLWLPVNEREAREARRQQRAWIAAGAIVFLVLLLVIPTLEITASNHIANRVQSR